MIRTINSNISLGACRTQKRGHHKGKVRLELRAHRLAHLGPRRDEVVGELRIVGVRRALCNTLMSLQHTVGIHKRRTLQPNKQLHERICVWAERVPAHRDGWRKKRSVSHSGKHIPSAKTRQPHNKEHEVHSPINPAHSIALIRNLPYSVPSALRRTFIRRGIIVG